VPAPTNVSGILTSKKLNEGWNFIATNQEGMDLDGFIKRGTIAKWRVRDNHGKAVPTTVRRMPGGGCPDGLCCLAEEKPSGSTCLFCVPCGQTPLR
jgi:hypothetical protein